MLDVVKKKVPEKLKLGIKRILEPQKYTAQKKYLLVIREKPTLEGKNAVVTGGSGAIGRAVCLKLAAEGATVYVAGRSINTISQVVDEIREMGKLAEPFVLDVMDEKLIEQRFQEIFSMQKKKLDIFISCAGGGSRERACELAEQSMEVINNILDVNLRGTLLCSRQAAKYMKISGGSMVLISSAIAFQGKTAYAEYGAAKAGIIGLMKSLALELGKYGINVNCVSPGFIQRGGYSEKTKKFLCASNCLHKVGTLEDVANAVFFLVSKDASFITGQNLIVDGGRTLGLMGEK